MERVASSGAAGPLFAGPASHGNFVADQVLDTGALGDHHHVRSETLDFLEHATGTGTTLVVCGHGNNGWTCGSQLKRCLVLKTHGAGVERIGKGRICSRLGLRAHQCPKVELITGQHIDNNLAAVTVAIGMIKL